MNNLRNLALWILIALLLVILFNFFQTVGFYGFVAWTPTLLIAKGIHITQSLGYSAIINVAAVIFPFLIMLFADKIERKWHACLSCLAIAVFGMWFGSVNSSWAVITLGACLADYVFVEFTDDLAGSQFIEMR